MNGRSLFEDLEIAHRRDEGPNKTGKVTNNIAGGDSGRPQFLSSTAEKHGKPSQGPLGRISRNDVGLSW